MLAAFLSQTLADNEMAFVATALMVAGIMATTVVILLHRASQLTGAARASWGLLLAGVAGIGVWTTHFVAMLGYRPDAALAYDPVVTFASAAIGVISIGGPLMACCYVRRRRVRAACGAVMGLGVGAMHFTGISALDDCVVSHSPLTSLLAVGLGAVPLAAALVIRGGRAGAVLQAVLIIVGVCALHFTGLHGLSFTKLAAGGSTAIDPAALSLIVVSAAILLCGAASAAVYTETRLEAQRQQAASALAEQDERFLLALRNMSNGLVMVDAEGQVIAFNSRAVEILGLDAEDVAPGRGIALIVGAMARRGDWDASEIADFVAEHRHWLAGEGGTRTERRFANGRTLAVSCRRMPEGGAVLSYDDVTESRAARDAMDFMALHDPLTALPNRRSFHDLVERLSTEGETCGALLLIDIDRFKWMNETFGHSVGDAVLIQIADRLRFACPDGELVFRFEGGEVAAIVRAGTESDARRLAEVLRAAVARPVSIEGEPVSVSCCIGFACVADGDWHQLLERASLALRRAKEFGRDRIESYESGMIERASRRRQIEVELAEALAQGAFELHYQPFYALPARRLIGFEALLRWRNPALGMVSPAEFVPISEANGLIVDIGAWVLEEACRQLARWPVHLHVAVNASAVQLRSPDFVGQVADALRRHGVEARRLEVELTETAMVEDGRLLSEVLKGLRRLGVRIAMDDFGTGYSSLAHLRDFELDRIKIDRSFIDTDVADLGSRAVIRAVASLAQDLNILTIGEGVETEEQIQRLVECGCDVGQGYLLGRPMDAAAASRLISLQMFDDDLGAEQREASQLREEVNGFRESRAAG
jgi:diguanylate cyclase (GGDEF)-like protein